MADDDKWGRDARGGQGLVFNAGLPERGGFIAAPGPVEVDLFGEQIRPAVQAVLKQRFIFPPFTVLSARDGDWQERKRAWLLCGIRSELGRAGDLLETGANSAYGGNGFAGQRGRKANATPGGSAMPRPGKYDTNKRGLVHGKPMTFNQEPAHHFNGLDAFRDEKKREELAHDPAALEAFDGYRGAGAPAAASSTSVFDPVLCELAYRWFSPPGGNVLDPFAGGSVRGVVASALGRKYHGIDLRPEQVEANKAQLDICSGPPPQWLAGDAREVLSLLPYFRADFLFSCPPYADLERYSDDPADLSTLAYPEFLEAYRAIIADCVSLLKDDAFACFVVGDVRGPDGNYYGFPQDTAAAFRAAGAPLYNEAILVTSVGSLPVRINGQFNASRKLGKTHQNVLVFLKGDAKRAAAKCGALSQSDLGAAQDPF